MIKLIPNLRSRRDCGGNKTEEWPGGSMRKAMPGPGKLKEEKVGTVLEGSLLLEELLSLVGRLSTYVGLRGGAMSKSAGMI